MVCTTISAHSLDQTSIVELGKPVAGKTLCGLGIRTNRWVDSHETGCGVLGACWSEEGGEQLRVNRWSSTQH